MITIVARLTDTIGRMTGALILNVLEADVCDWIRDELRSAPAHDATVYGVAADAIVAASIRKTARITPSSATQALVRQRLLDQRGSLEAHFGLLLGDLEPLQFLRYTTGDHFVAHEDGNTPLLHDDSRFRRVSVVLFLSAASASPAFDTYGGGELVLYSASPNTTRRFTVPAVPGTLAAFKSETTHEVTAVTHGARYTVASWFRTRE